MNAALYCWFFRSILPAADWVLTLVLDRRNYESVVGLSRYCLSFFQTHRSVNLSLSRL